MEKCYIDYCVLTLLPCATAAVTVCSVYLQVEEYSQFLD